MRKYFAIACTILLMLAAFSCKNNSSKSPQEILKEAANNSNINVVGSENYLVSIPKDWRSTDTTAGSLKEFAIISPSKEDGISATLTIINESMQGYSFDAYLKASIDNMAQMLPSYKKLDEGVIQTATNKVTWIRGTYSINNVSLDIISYLLPIDNIAYIFTGVTKNGSMDKYKNDFDRIVKSFKLK